MESAFAFRARSSRSAARGLPADHRSYARSLVRPQLTVRPATGNCYICTQSRQTLPGRPNRRPDQPSDLRSRQRPASAAESRPASVTYMSGGTTASTNRPMALRIIDLHQPPHLRLHLRPNRPRHGTLLAKPARRATRCDPSPASPSPSHPAPHSQTSSVRAASAHETSFQ